MATPLGRGVMLGRFSHSVLPIVLFVLFLYVQNNAVTKTILASRVEPVVFLDPRLWRNEIRTAFIFVQLCNSRGKLAPALKTTVELQQAGSLQVKHCQLLTTCPPASYLISLCQGFLICKMGKIGEAVIIGRCEDPMR